MARLKVIGLLWRKQRCDVKPAWALLFLTTCPCTYTVPSETPSANECPFCLLPPVSVSIKVSYTRPPGSTLDVNVYRAASGPVALTCTATGAGGTNPDTDYTYQWTSSCRNCPFQMSNDRMITRGAVSSNDGGTHTCTATRPGGEMASASIVFNIVGEWQYWYSTYLRVHIGISTLREYRPWILLYYHFQIQRSSQFRPTCMIHRPVQLEYLLSVLT